MAALETRQDGRIGRILLNRPDALNALDLPMIREMSQVLVWWRDKPRVNAVVIEGAGERAFCAGGDIRALYELARSGDAESIETFFREEYVLNRAIAEFPKPYVALINGVCMGGGMGVSIHGTFRIATEHAALAMPETAIGLFPDVGGSYFLPRLPGALGMYLALTGTRLNGPDAAHAGFATHFVPRRRLAALSAGLAQDGAAVLAGYAEQLPDFSLARHRTSIDRCFSASSVPEILHRLEAERSDWARETTAALRARSPSSLCWSFELIRRGEDSVLGQCLARELALTRAVTRHHDLMEGIRAMVIDKDRNPSWRPPRIEDVDPAAIQAMFPAS
ncbi:MAG: enoyl-CoA hydratase/isomerase family protein [Acetobacteraceae bacterium]|nr:enoyl-CoA hydratase/isomerase family protein [Acetobacteraceae bacterium]